MNPGPRNAITDVAGIAVGHHHRIGEGWATGVTVVLAPRGTVGAVDVRGGGPGTRETDLLDPANLVQHVDAVVLCGGSAYGLAAADGVMRWLSERGRGFAIGARPHEVVPIVPAAALFDLPMGEWGNVPDGSFGYAACEAAGSEAQAAVQGTVGASGDGGGNAGAVAQGSVGAGAGAKAGLLKGGVGTASTVLGGVYTVGALVAANPSGDAVSEGVPFAAAFESGGEFGLRAPSRDDIDAAAARLAGAAGAHTANPFNTTIGVVATDAALTRSQCRRLAIAAHDGLARAVRPAHTLFDGDTVFVLATGTRPVGDDPVVVNALATAAADTFARAVVHAVLSAQPVGSMPSYRQLWPSALE